MPQIPKQVGPYEIVALLGSGGMGEVYRARDPRLNRDVAIKILPQEFVTDRNRRQRFEQEARAVAALNHPNIVGIYDVGDGYMVTELVDGPSLRGLELTHRQIIDIGAQIADALATAHDAGITHRDLKPDNILYTKDGRVKILDFGLAKISQEQNQQNSRDATVTNPGTATGTPGYMAPEQVRGQHVDHRADMFSLGVVLYELLAHQPAFKGESAVDVMHAIVHQDPAELPESVPQGLARIVHRCLEKNPAKRFQSGRDLAFALRSLSGSVTSSHPALVAPPVQGTSWTRWVGIGLAAAALAVFAAILFTQEEAPSGVDLSRYHFKPFAYSEQQEHSGVWAPNGQTVAYIEESSGQARLMARTVDAPMSTRLVNNISASPGQLAWSPDSSTIYFLQSGPQSGVYEVSAAGGIARAVLRSASTIPGNGLGQLDNSKGKGKGGGKGNFDGRGKGKGKRKGKGFRGAPVAQGSITAFDLSADGQSLAIWQSVPVENGATQSSVWISSPLGATPVRYGPVPEIETPFTPVYLRFSRDTSRLFVSFYGNDGAETWLLPFPAGQGEPHRIFADVHWNATVPVSWMPAPDNRHVVLAGNPVPASGQQLWMADVESETLTRIMALPEGGQTTPAVSPDGKQLLFAQVARDRDIVQLPVDGSPMQTLLATTLPEFGPAWSPKGDQFAYITRRNGEPELWVRSTDGQFDRPIVTAHEFPNLEALIGPVFTPDGSRIAYTAVLAGSDRRRSLAVSPAAGGTPTVISDGYAPSFYPGPTGGMLAFLWLKPDGTLPIANLLLGSSVGPSEIMVPGGLGAPEWSPDGDWLAAPRSGMIELVEFSAANRRRSWVLNRDSLPPNCFFPEVDEGEANDIAQIYQGLPRCLIPDVGAEAIAWAPDSKTIYGLDYTSNPPALKSVDVETQKITTIAEYPGVSFQPVLENTYTGSIRLSLSPDGKALATAISKGQSDVWILDGFQP